MKKICIIYYLSDLPPFTMEQAHAIRDAYNCSFITLIQADNQLEGLQYPYIRFDEVENTENNG